MTKMHVQRLLLMRDVYVRETDGQSACHRSNFSSPAARTILVKGKGEERDD